MQGLLGLAGELGLNPVSSCELTTDYQICRQFWLLPPGSERPKKARRGIALGISAKKTSRLTLTGLLLSPAPEPIT